LLADPGLRQITSVSGQQRARKFYLWEKITQEIQVEYEALMQPLPVSEAASATETRDRVA